HRQLRRQRRPNYLTAPEVEDQTPGTAGVDPVLTHQNVAEYVGGPPNDLMPPPRRVEHNEIPHHSGPIKNSRVMSPGGSNPSLFSRLADEGPGSRSGKDVAGKIKNPSGSSRHAGRHGSP